ncbi:MAG TPA: hypothetical protein VHQ90_07475 [Thermoanaerobaculia bacterium]|nr:hypothetical protein [Thermoanaerobaculia bacterium]
MLRMPHLILLLLGPLATSCIRVGDLSQSAMRYNEAVEEAQNKMLLLNIVRAKLARPLYITDLSKITGSIKLDLSSGGVETDYGRSLGSLTSGKLAPSVDYVHNPTFDVNVLSQQDFMQGFMQPISKELLAYYWEQRWGKEFLLYLFVHQVTVRSLDDTSEPEETFENSPRESMEAARRNFERFGEWVTTFLASEPRFVRKDVGIGPCLPNDKVANLKVLVAAAQKGLTVTAADPRHYQLQQAKPELSLASREEAGRTTELAAVCKKATEDGLEPFKAAEILWQDCKSKLPKTMSWSQWEYLEETCKHRERIYQGLCAGRPDCSRCPAKVETGAGKAEEGASYINKDETGIGKGEVGASYTTGGVRKEATLYLRSPESILYYLGEIMRLESRDGLVPEIYYDGKPTYKERPQPLFVALTVGRNGHGAVSQCPAVISVRYEGNTFIIPGSRDDGDYLAQAPDGGLGQGRPEKQGEKPMVAEPSPRVYLETLDNVKCEAGQSMHALSLLSQLIALQKSAKDVPTSSVIRAISQ